MGDARQDRGELPRRSRPFHSIRRKGRRCWNSPGRGDRRNQRHLGRLYRRRLQDGDRRKASAKVSFRLVGTQDPAAIREAFRSYISAKIPADCSVEFHPHGGSPAIHLSSDSPGLPCEERAFRRVAEPPLSSAWWVGPDRRRFPEDARHGIAACWLRPQR